MGGTVGMGGTVDVGGGTGGPLGNTKILTEPSGAAIVGTEGALANTGAAVGICREFTNWQYNNNSINQVT